MQINDQCCAKSILPKEVLTDIFSNIQAIHQLHRDFLLPKLEARMKEWYVFFFGLMYSTEVKKIDI